MSLVIWAAVAASAVHWGMRLFTRSTPVPPTAQLASAVVQANADLQRLMGQPPAQPVAEAAPVAAASRFTLLGVVAPKAGQHDGLALISIEGKPARAVAVGKAVEPGLQVLKVSHREVALGANAGAPAFNLSLPALPEPNRGRPGDAVPAAPGVPAVPGAGLPPPAAPLVAPPRPTPIAAGAQRMPGLVQVAPTAPEQANPANGHGAPTQ
jgi:general secretion pathway protein C